MDKTQAEQIIQSTFEALIKDINIQDKASVDALLLGLNRLGKELRNDSVPQKVHNAGSLEEEYKALAEESIASYAQTKESVEKINQEQQRILNEQAKNDAVKLDDIMHQFGSVKDQIQSQMESANEQIAQLNQQIAILKETSNLDPLTRTFNRRAMDSYLQSLCNTKGRVPKSAIILIDIDDFKVVNDTYGHLAGDRVLVFLAKLVNSILRDGDKVFRFGGEEFLLLLNRCNPGGIESVANRILKAVRTNKLLYKEHQIRITLSMGATMFKEGDGYEQFIERADKLLYQAKANGKDQLVTG